MVRVQIELTPDNLQRLDRLMEEVGLRTRKELMLNALTLLAWAVRERRAGRVIASIDEDRQSREVLLPILESLMTGDSPFVPQDTTTARPLKLTEIRRPSSAVLDPDSPAHPECG
jgi:hypothetical protein